MNSEDLLGGENQAEPRPVPAPRQGHIVLAGPGSFSPAKNQLASLYELGDPDLSELNVDEFLDQIMARVVRLLNVDTVSVLLLDEYGTELVARASLGVESEVIRHTRIPLGVGFAGRIAATRMPISISEIETADIVNPLLSQLGIRSLLGVPLIVEGELIGVLHVGALQPRTFTPEDLGALQLVAARIGPGIARSTLYTALQQEHELTLMLQRSLMPQQLVKVPYLEIAAGYIAASAEAGGDWYDAFALDGGRIGVTVGDVVGHGSGAATQMGQLRTCLRAYAIENHPPAKALELVNRFAWEMPSRPIATAIYAVIDPSTGAVTIASAGHLPQALLSPDEHSLLEPEPGPPLGAFPDHKCIESRFTLNHGDSIVLFSDGLIERRGVPLDSSLDDLLEVIGDAVDPVDVCTTALHELMPEEGLSDDAVILAIKRR